MRAMLLRLASQPAFRLKPCCGAKDLVRVHRPLLLRLLAPARQLYVCPHCGAKVFYKR